MDNHEDMPVDVFLKNQLYQQMIDSNAGSTTIMQALVGEIGKKIIKDGNTDGAVGSMKELNELSKSMQLNTIDIMKAMSGV